MSVAESERRRNLRRSTRVPIRVRIEVQATGLSCEGETVTVNLHGALLNTSQPLELGAQIKLHVQLTGKSADGRVVFASRENALEFGIALDRPENIWGISLPPPDWDTRFSDQ
ncbi:MAG: PilZ domain-containing protein [Terriglobales bacterium]